MKIILVTKLLFILRVSMLNEEKRSFYYSSKSYIQLWLIKYPNLICYKRIFTHVYL